jgi:hypothetical protein
MTKFRAIHVGPACRAGLRGPAATCDLTTIQSEDASPEFTAMLKRCTSSEPAFGSPCGESPARQAGTTWGGFR